MSAEKPRIWPLILCLAVAVLLRAPGLRSAVFQDEVHILIGVSHYVSNKTIVPPWFDWPPLFSYLAVPATGITSLVGGKMSGLPPGEWAVLQSAFVDQRLVAGTRILSLLFSLCTIAAIYLMPLRPAHSGTRVAATLIYLFSPVAVQYGAYGLPEEGMVLCVALSLLCSIRYSIGGNWKWLCAAGALGGLAAAFKFNGAMACGACAVAALVAQDKNSQRRITALSRAACAAILVFLILAPSFLLATEDAFGGLLWEGLHVGKARFGPQYPHYIGMPLFLVKHEPGLLLGVMTAVIVAKSKDRALLILLTIPALNFLAVGGWTRMDPNYWYPSIPAVSAAFGLAVPSHSSGRLRALQLFGISALLVAFLFIIGPPAYRRDNYDVMADWLTAELPADAVVVRDGSYTPKIWSPIETHEFLDGRGSALSPAAREQFDQRLTHSPKAASIILRDKQLATASAADPIDALPAGSWLLASELPMTRIRDYPLPDGADGRIYQLQKKLYGSLQSGVGWKLMFAAENGSGQAQYAYRKD
ncbi:hypothetical protein BH09SUM1_BH09SUM1_30440 [soil metagenome]